VRTIQWFSLISMAASLAWSAERVMVTNLDLINVNPKFQYSTLKQLKVYTDEAGRYDLVLPARGDSALAQPTQDEALAQAREKSFPYLLMGDLNAIGDKLFISFKLIQTSSGAILWSDRMKAADPEDLDPILMRVGKSLGSEKKAVNSEDIYSVTYEDSKGLQKKQVFTMVGLGIGGLFLPNSPTDDKFLPCFEGYYSYDARTIIAEVRAGYENQGDLGGFQFGINVFKPINNDAQSFFIGGGLAYAFMVRDYETEEEYGSWGESETKNGLAFNVTGGYLFNRTSTLQVRFDVGYNVYAFKINDKVPQGVKATLNLSWAR